MSTETGGVPVTTSNRYLEADKKRAAAYRLDARRPESWRGDLNHWRQFSDYLGSRDPWKATPEDVAAWCAFRADRGLKPRTVRAGITSLNFIFEKAGKGYFQGRMGTGTLELSPARHPMVRSTLRGIWRVHAVEKAQVTPLLLETLEKLIDAQPNTLWGKRNRAFFALAWAGGRRFRELTSLDVTGLGDGRGYIEFRHDGMIIALRGSKARPTGPKEYYGIPIRSNAPRYCPTYLVRDWIGAAGIEEGPLFPTINFGRLHGNTRTAPGTMRELFYRSLAEIGISKEGYGAKSFRAGCIFWLISQGVHPKRVAEHTGHRRVSTMMGYIGTTPSVGSSPLADTRWAV